MTDRGHDLGMAIWRGNIMVMDNLGLPMTAEELRDAREYIIERHEHRKQIHVPTMAEILEKRDQIRRQKAEALLCR